MSFTFYFVIKISERIFLLANHYLGFQVNQVLTIDYYLVKVKSEEYVFKKILKVMFN